MEILDRMLCEEPVPVGDYVPELPEDYASLLMRMLAKDPAERPCSWDALLDEISNLLQQFRVLKKDAAAKSPRGNF